MQAQLDMVQSLVGIMMEGLVGLTGIVGSLTKRVEELAEVQKRTNENVNEVTERVNAFIDYVERYIENQNGNHKGRRGER